MQLRKFANEKNAEVAHVVLAWHLTHNSIDAVIPGAKRAEQVLDNLKTLDVRLTEEPCMRREFLVMYDRPFNEIFKIMQASFPKSEMGTYARQEALLANPYYRLITEEDDNNKIIAFLAAWEFPLFRFIEHIAVDPDIRGGGIGGKLVAAYIEEEQKPVLLEVEPPITAMAQRRVNFYERLGFHFNLFDYIQPPLQEGQADLPLNIMSYPELLVEAEFALFKKVLYAEVYKKTTII